MTPDNAGYFHAAYIAAAVILGGYRAVMWSRGGSWRARLRRR
jgi:hypothetical protein